MQGTEDLQELYMRMLYVSFRYSECAVRDAALNEISLSLSLSPSLSLSLSL